MPSYISPGGDLVVEAWATGASGQAYTGSNAFGGGGGEYARKRISTSPGDVINIIIVFDVDANKNGGGSFLRAKAGTTHLGGTGGIGDILHDGGNGGDIPTTGVNPRGNAGGGGAGASRDAAGGNGQDGVADQNSPAAGGSNGSGLGSGGQGGVWFDNAAAGNGQTPGGGGGGQPSAPGAGPGVGTGAPAAWAIWRIQDWDGNPATELTLPKPGKTPVSSGGNFEPSPAALPRKPYSFMQ